jgi:hypothetical protein
MLFSKRVTAIILILVLAAAGAWSYLKNQQHNQTTITPEITLEPGEQMTQPLQSAMSEAEKQTIEEAFVKEGAEMTLLKDVTGGQGVGTAWRQYDGTKFYHKVDANNLPGLDKGFYYEGWLVGESGFFSTGRMAVDSGRGKLYYTSSEDKTIFRGVVITLEAEDGNEAPDKHILEGSF